MNRLSVLAVCAVLWAMVACADREAPVAAERERLPVEATASVDKAVATTGDVLNFRISVDHDPAYVVRIPEVGARIQGFRIIDTETDERTEADGRRVREQVYRLRADLVGSYILPSVVVGFVSAETPEAEPEGVVETSEIFVEVDSVLPEDGSAEDILGLKPLRAVESDRSWAWIVTGVAGALAAALLFWLWRRRSAERPRPIVPPHVEAFRALDALRATDFEDDAALRRYYFTISEVVRTYVEGRFGLNATDLTTEEILPRLPELGELEAATGERLSRFLRHTDQVKFAEYRPLEAEIGETYEDALSFVEETQPRPETEGEEESRAA